MSVTSRAQLASQQRYGLNVHTEHSGYYDVGESYTTFETFLLDCNTLDNADRALLDDCSNSDDMFCIDSSIAGMRHHMPHERFVALLAKYQPTADEVRMLAIIDRAVVAASLTTFPCTLIGVGHVRVLLSF
jgi:hypothetical protein